MCNVEQVLIVHGFCSGLILKTLWEGKGVLFHRFFSAVQNFSVLKKKFTLVYFNQNISIKQKRRLTSTRYTEQVW